MISRAADDRARSHRRTVLVIASLLLLAGCTPAVEKRPSIFLIVVDTLRADHLGSYGYERPTSPELDALAAEGLVFEKAIATSSWTLPSMGSLLTGELPSRHGAGVKRDDAGDFVREEGRKTFHALDPTADSLPETLREAGYATAAVVANPFLSPALGFDRGFDHYAYLEDAPPAPAVVDAALSWLDGQGGEPVFLLLHLFDPHVPYQAGEGFAGRFTGPLGTPFSLPVEKTRKVRQRLDRMSEGERAFITAAYDEEIAFADREIRRFLDALAERGRLDQALFVLTSDHGEELFDHGGFEHGHTMFQELLHVPLLFAGPGIPAARVDQPVSLLDLGATLLEAAGIEDASFGTGRGSFWARVRGGTSLGDGDLIAEGNLYGAHRYAILRWPHKLVVGEPETATRLYDLERDAAERDPLEEDALPELGHALARELSARIAAAARARGPVVEGELPALTRNRLRALGYLD